MAQKGCRVMSLSLISALDVGGGLVNAKPRPLYPRERDLMAVVQEALGPVWTVAEDLARTGIRCPKRPAPRKGN
jgi:hypothetical protein